MMNDGIYRKEENVFHSHDLRVSYFLRLPVWRYTGLIPGIPTFLSLKGQYHIMPVFGRLKLKVKKWYSANYSIAEG